MRNFHYVILSCELLEEELKEGRSIYTYAYYANDAFCCELFLKCLCTIRTGNHPRGHKLDELFKQLPTREQDRVEELYEEMSKGDAWHREAALESPSKSNALRDIFTDGADVFESMRYWYERPFKHRRGYFRWPIAALRARILEVHPHLPRQPELWTKLRSATHQTLKLAPWSGSTLSGYTPTPAPHHPNQQGHQKP